MGNLPSALRAGQAGNAALPSLTCSGETPGWDPGAVGRKDRHQSSLTKDFLCNYDFVLGLGEVAMGHNQAAATGGTAQYGPVWPSKDPGLSFPRALAGVGVPGEAN